MSEGSYLADTNQWLLREGISCGRKRSVTQDHHRCYFELPSYAWLEWHSRGKERIIPMTSAKEELEGTDCRIVQAEVGGKVAL